jgi:phosphohistidine phosphatase SixA
MAQRLEFQTSPCDPREALRARLERAPDDHAEALLAAYDLLRQLHERGILDIARSALATSDELLAQAVDEVDTPQASRAVRQLLVWRQVVDSIDPESFRVLLQAIPEGLAKASVHRVSQAWVVPCHLPRAEVFEAVLPPTTRTDLAEKVQRRTVRGESVFGTHVC